eukprot:tig00020830_g14471.t1
MTEELPELSCEDPAAPDGIGRAAIYEQFSSYFGIAVETTLLYATRRLPGPLGVLGIKVPAQRSEDGHWRLAHFQARVKTLSGMHVAPMPVSGCRVAAVHLSRGWLFEFMPRYLNLQVVSRIFGKNQVHMARLLLSEYAAEGGSAPAGGFSPPYPRFRDSIFASGSCGIPPHLSAARRASADAGLGPDGEGDGPPAPTPPSILVSYGSPLSPGPEAGAEAGQAAPPPAASTEELFFDLVGVQAPGPQTSRDTWGPQQPLDASPPSTSGSGESSADSPATSAAAAAPKPIQVIRDDIGVTSEPSVMSRYGEAMRVSLEIALRLESMSLHEPPRPPSSSAPPSPSTRGPATPVASWDAPPPPYLPPPPSAERAASPGGEAPKRKPGEGGAELADRRLHPPPRPSAPPPGAPPPRRLQPLAAQPGGAAPAHLEAAASAAASAAPQRPQRRRKKPVPGAAEAPAPNGFIQFCRSKKDGVLLENPNITSREMASILGEMWRRTPHAERAGYQQVAREARARELAAGPKPRKARKARKKKEAGEAPRGRAAPAVRVKPEPSGLSEEDEAEEEEELDSDAPTPGPSGGYGPASALLYNFPQLQAPPWIHVTGPGRQGPVYPGGANPRLPAEHALGDVPSGASTHAAPGPPRRPV